MKRFPDFLVVVFALGFAILLGILLGSYSRSTLGEEISNPSCPLIMADIITSAKGDVYGASDPADQTEPTSTYLAYYSVQGDLITNPTLEPVPDDLRSEQQDLALQTQAWQIFTKLIPAQDRKMVAKYDVFTDGYSNTLAAVDQTKDNPAKWALEIDIADLKDRDAFLFTLIHEYAHILTLNATQMTPDQEIVDDPDNPSLQKEKAALCSSYFTGMGCSHADSYMNAFYNRFWLDIKAEWESIDALQYKNDPSAYYRGLHDFYLAHRDQFVDDYSTTHPTEDIAESFAYFVFAAKPSGSLIKDQKILFFYDYPELVQLRNSILNGACTISH